MYRCLYGTPALAKCYPEYIKNMGTRQGVLRPCKRERYIK